MNKNKSLTFKPTRITLYSVCITLVVAFAFVSFKAKDENVPTKDTNKQTSQKAFMQVYKVLMSPRCLNCHPAGDVPLQGEDSHLHTMGVQRGEDGNGVYALKCTNCHQPKNTPGFHMPPGNPTWKLPESHMKLVFEGKSPRQLAIQLKDPNQNGGKTMEQLFHHIAEDSLVLWGWNPGDGRALPPLKHDEFMNQFRLWLDNGVAVPDK